MSRICKVCGKHPHFGHNVSHSNRKTPRMWRPNLQRIRIQTPQGTKRAYVCTDCISAGKVTKPERRRVPPPPAAS